MVPLDKHSESSCCPIGSGAAIHASAAKHISKWDMVCHAGIDDEQSSAAVGGRLLVLKLFRPEMSGPIFLLGVNQHLARDSNTALRRIFCAGLWRPVCTHWRHECCSRWGYSSRSKRSPYFRMGTSMRTCAGLRRFRTRRIMPRGKHVYIHAGQSSGLVALCTLEHIATCFLSHHADVPSSSFCSWAGLCWCMSPFVSNGATAALPCGPQKAAQSCNTLEVATSSGYQLVTT